MDATIDRCKMRVELCTLKSELMDRNVKVVLQILQGISRAFLSFADELGTTVASMYDERKLVQTTNQIDVSTGQ